MKQLPGESNSHYKLRKKAEKQAEKNRLRGRFVATNDGAPNRAQRRAMKKGGEVSGGMPE